MNDDRNRSEVIRDALSTAAELDRQWMTPESGRDDPRCTPWMPFPVHDFIALVAEALPETSGDRFLEIGCGIGTRMLVAQAVFGLEVSGIERVPEYARAAAELGLDVQVTDALGWGGYSKPDLIWFNRPFRDPVQQRQLEMQVWQDAAPDTVIICANLENTPPPDWWLVLDDREVRRWIVRKP